ncbi:MAG: hypothetical protein AYL32_014590 [Candidatus Bathyarchaeota archaeon B26-2]|nr:MAG: hypothetical protein AYL32_014590 [Candidatus Bathyarchaeota archaeon B26-2]
MSREIELIVETEVNPTEDPEKVLTALNRLFGDLQYKIEERGDRRFLTGREKSTSGLSTFRNLLQRELICDAARKVLFRGTIGNTITFYLNKQVAYMGHISFSKPVGESPLGPIRVEIRCEDPRRLIDWLAPKTS